MKIEDLYLKLQFFSQSNMCVTNNYLIIVSQGVFPVVILSTDLKLLGQSEHFETSESVMKGNIEKIQVILSFFSILIIISITECFALCHIEEKNI